MQAHDGKRGFHHDRARHVPIESTVLKITFRKSEMDSSRTSKG